MSMKFVLQKFICAAFLLVTFLNNANITFTYDCDSQFEDDVMSCVSNSSDLVGWRYENYSLINVTSKKAQELCCEKWIEINCIHRYIKLCRKSVCRYNCTDEGNLTNAYFNDVYTNLWLEILQLQTTQCDDFRFARDCYYDHEYVKRVLIKGAGHVFVVLVLATLVILGVCSTIFFGNFKEDIYVYDY